MTRHSLMRVVIGFGVGATFGGICGFIVGIFVFPYLFPPPEVNEPLAERPASRIIARARFIHANPADPIHYGRGTANIYADLLRLEADFEVGPGPKFHVYLVGVAEVTPQTEVETMMFVDLGRLKAFSGSQNYPIPRGITLDNYRSVVIWCEQFNVLISPASIAPVRG